MKIGIFANFLLFEPAGIGKYSQNLLKNLFKIDHKNQYFLYFSFFRHRQVRLKLIQKRLGKLPKNVKIRIFSVPAAWLETLFASSFDVENIIKDPLDIYFSPYVSGIPKKGFKKMVTTCHDLVFLRFPEHRGKKLSNYYLKRHKTAVRNCQKIIAVSESTKKDLQKFLAVNPSKIKVIYEAADARFRPIKDQKKIRKIIGRYLPHSFNPDFRYILSVGTLEPRKNLSKLVEAYSMLPHQILRKYKLVLVGAKGWNESELQKTINNLNLKDRVLLPGFVKDEDLPYIYNGASIFAYPSLYEGFGLPPLEALACGIPVVASNLSSLPEVMGRAALLVDPTKEEEIVKALKQLIFEPKLAKKLASRGPEQAKKFSWIKTAKETLKLFEEVYQQK